MRARKLDSTQKERLFRILCNPAVFKSKLTRQPVNLCSGNFSGETCNNCNQEVKLLLTPVEKWNCFQMRRSMASKFQQRAEPQSAFVRVDPEGYVPFFGPSGIERAIVEPGRVDEDALEDLLHELRNIHERLIEEEGTPSKKPRFEGLSQGIFRRPALDLSCQEADVSNADETGVTFEKARKTVDDSAQRIERPLQKSSENLQNVVLPSTSGCFNISLSQTGDPLTRNEENVQDSSIVRNASSDACRFFTIEPPNNSSSLKTGESNSFREEIEERLDPVPDEPRKALEELNAFCDQVQARLDRSHSSTHSTAESHDDHIPGLGGSSHFADVTSSERSELRDSQSDEGSKTHSMSSTKAEDEADHDVSFLDASLLSSTRTGDEDGADAMLEGHVSRYIGHYMTTLEEVTEEESMQSKSLEEQSILRRLPREEDELSLLQSETHDFEEGKKKGRKTMFMPSRNDESSQENEDSIGKFANTVSLPLVDYCSDADDEQDNAEAPSIQNPINQKIRLPLVDYESEESINSQLEGNDSGSEGIENVEISRERPAGAAVAMSSLVTNREKDKWNISLMLKIRGTCSCTHRDIVMQ